MRMRLDEIMPLGEHKAMLIARAVLLAHKDAAKTNGVDLDDLRKQQYCYMCALIQRTRWLHQ